MYHSLWQTFYYLFVYKMESWKVLYSKWNNNECYTPEYWVEPIIKYLMKYKKIRWDIIDHNKLDTRNYYNGKFWDLEISQVWENSVCVELFGWHDVVDKTNIKITYTPNIIRCPFDTEESNFVKLLRKEWFTVVCSHIDEWKDFYTYEPEQRDIIVSNPPFTNKRKIFERCLSFNKPFSLLMSNTRLNDAAPKQLFKDKELQLLMFDKRIEYSWNKKITFSSSYYCYNLLPKQIIMEFITKK